jgi:hypothetical protein
MRRLLPLLLAAVSHGASANPSSVTLHSVFTGPDNCLDIVNAGNHDQLRVTRCGTYSGQMWEIVPDAANGFVRLRTLFTGADMCLDVADDGNDDQVHMAPCANVPGQQWHMDRTDPGLGGHLWSQSTGQGKCLDIVDDRTGRVRLASCGNYSSQYWIRRDGPRG